MERSLQVHTWPTQIQSCDMYVAKVTPLFRRSLHPRPPTENAFRPERVAQIAETRFGLDGEAVLENLLVSDSAVTGMIMRGGTRKGQYLRMGDWEGVAAGAHDYRYKPLSSHSRNRYSIHHETFANASLSRSPQVARCMTHEHQHEMLAACCAKIAEDDEPFRLLIVGECSARTGRSYRWPAPPSHPPTSLFSLH